MDANKIIDNLLDRIKLLVRENAFLVAQLQSYEEKAQAQVVNHDGDQTEAEVKENA